MWVLSRRKVRIAEALGSQALRTDAVESITCGWLSSWCDRVARPAHACQMVGRFRDFAGDSMVARQRGLENSKRRLLFRVSTKAFRRRSLPWQCLRGFGLCFAQLPRYCYNR
jgi:hypothetical protein